MPGIYSLDPEATESRGHQKNRNQALHPLVWFLNLVRLIQGVIDKNNPKKGHFRLTNGAAVLESPKGVILELSFGAAVLKRSKRSHTQFNTTKINYTIP